MPRASSTWTRRHAGRTDPARAGLGPGTQTTAEECRAQSLQLLHRPVFLDRLEAALRERDGFITTHQAERLGVRRSKLTALVRGGDLQPVMRSVYVLAQRKPMPQRDERTYAAWPALDGHRRPWERDVPIVVLSHASAARLHGPGTLPDDAVEVTSATRRTTTFPGIRLHVAPLFVSDRQWAMERRVMVTTPERTIADLAVSPIERSYVLDALDDAIEGRTATREAVLAATARRSPRRVAGITQPLSHVTLPDPVRLEASVRSAGLAHPR